MRLRCSALRTIFGRLLVMTSLTTVAYSFYAFVVAASPAPQQLPVVTSRTERSPDGADGDTDSRLWQSGGPCVREFLRSYERRCSRYLLPHKSNIVFQRLTTAPDDHSQTGRNTRNMSLCPCVPKQLLGSSSLQHDTKLTLYDIRLSESSVGSPSPLLSDVGRWYPAWCQPRQRVAVLVPYRSRADDLRRLVATLQPFLRRQLLDFHIFVIEQKKPPEFNRASLLNVGYMEARKLGRFDCIILHDVDMLPKDDRNFYTCSSTPRHVGKYRDIRYYRLHRYFGGVVAFRPKDFERINGFSNAYYGWGGEDDDLRSRVKAKRIVLAERFPECVAGYSTRGHDFDAGNSAVNVSNRFHFNEKSSRRDGLNSLRYSVVSYSRLELYTRISVDLPPVTSAARLARFRRRRE